MSTSTATPTRPQTTYEDAIESAVSRFDTRALARRYEAQGNFLVIDDFLDEAVLAPVLRELEMLDVQRKWVPGYKSGGSASAFTLNERAPAMAAIYRSPALIRFVDRVVSARVMQCPPEDPHAYAVYMYTQAGDHVGFHYDKSWYRGARYTLLFGLVNQCESKLVCQTMRGGQMHEDQVATHPGTLVLFDGDSVRHALTPLGEQQVRASLSLQYLTDQHMGRPSRFISNLKDAMTYFGFKSWLGR